MCESMEQSERAERERALRGCGVGSEVEEALSLTLKRNEPPCPSPLWNATYGDLTIGAARAVCAVSHSLVVFYILVEFHQLQSDCFVT